MYKGKVKTIIGSGAAFITSEALKDDVYCNKKYVQKLNLSQGDYVEFEAEMGFKNLEVKEIKKLEPQNPLFEMALRIDKLSAEEYDTFCEDARNYVRQKDFKDITTSKIRNIFSAVQDAKSVKKIKMLRPKFAYLAGRDNKTGFFMNELDKLVKKISNDDELKSFKQFFEAIVCYKREIEK